ncbi:translation initiation factor IF-2 [Entomophthora muscae]|uniref:Translation initiation factor IF-2 n=1 Tax=Entomophthora muscae TaxID=34485 RepID=A0ACC2U4B3_9FUNG|nr:translation initiation factor IF-2 [Entomophthora muscae]
MPGNFWPAPPKKAPAVEQATLESEFPFKLPPRERSTPPPEESNIAAKPKVPEKGEIFVFTVDSATNVTEKGSAWQPAQNTSLKKPRAELPQASSAVKSKESQWAKEKFKPKPSEPEPTKTKRPPPKIKKASDSDEPARLKRRPKYAIRPKQSKDIFLPTTIKLSNLSLLLGVHYEDMRRKMKRAGLPNYPHDYLLSSEDAGLIAMEFNLNPTVDEHQAKDLYPQDHPSVDAKGNPHPVRAPVVTIMGHVDHGKTTLLDTLRKTSVAAGEAGGITQHIGAFQVKLSEGQLITFLDTPGHAAFRSMRARGAEATDLVVLVIAADDGIMPQTVEAIQHAQEADVPIIIALTKCDKPTKNLTKIKEDLLNYQIQVEDFGGDTQVVEVAAPTGLGLDTLKETILTLAEVMELRAPIDCPTEAVVLEAHTSRGLGAVSTVVVKNGTLRPGQFLVAGNAWCKVRNILNENGKMMPCAAPGVPAQVVGWRGFPDAGDLVLQAQNEDEAKTVVENRSRKGDVKMELKQAQDINEKRQREAEDSETKPQEIPVLPIILKADVSGSLEAVEECIAQLPSGKVFPRVVLHGVGPPTKADLDVAVASKGVVALFNLKVDREVSNLAHLKKVPIISNPIIYKLLEEIQGNMMKLLPTIHVYNEEAQLEILKVFEMKLKGRNGLAKIAGCRVKSGTLLKSHLINVTRPSEESPVAQELEIDVLKHHKDDITSAKAGMECAIELKRFSKFKEGDILIACTKSEAPKSLE